MKLLLSIIFLAGLTTQAQTNRFADIVSKFGSGTTPTKQEVFGWFSGRCYKQAKPDQALAGLLAGKGLVKQDGTSILKLMSLALGTKYEQDYFDEITLYKRDVIARTLNQDLSRTTLAEPVGNYLTSYLQGEELRITKVGKHFLGERVNFHRDSNGIVEVVTFACEFTQKVY